VKNPEQKNSEKPDVQHISRLREVASVGLTALRYSGVEYIARQARDGKPIGPALAAFMAADVADGQILDDTPLRRVTDGVVDTAAVVRVMYELGKRYPEARAGIAAVALGPAATGAAPSPKGEGAALCYTRAEPFHGFPDSAPTADGVEDSSGKLNTQRERQSPAACRSLTLS